jgi:hypothetical protein
MLGVSLLETGDVDAAKDVSVFCDLSCCFWPDIVQAFQSLIQPPSPQPPPPSAHLYLAQLSEENPRRALQHYQAAVGILVNQLKGKQTAKNSVTTNPSDESEIKKNIIRALIG